MAAALLAAVLVLPVTHDGIPVQPPTPAYHYPVAVMSPMPPPAPVSHSGAFSGVGGGCASGYVHDLIVAYDWNDAEALGIASRESGCNPNAKNPISSASGVFQLVSTWWAGKFDPFDPVANIAQAYSMWLADGGSFCPGQWCV